VSESQAARNRRWVAGQSGPPELSGEARAFTEQHPSLQLLVFCTLGGVRVTARVSSFGRDGKLRSTEIASARFRPKAVSERLVVEWGERALRHWLEENPQPQADPS
jgi:hypothetical protein